MFNDLKNASKILDPTMFSNDTNFFYAHSSIKTLFKTVNEELNNLSEWFACNKLSLNTDKTKYTFFHGVFQNHRPPSHRPPSTVHRPPSTVHRPPSTVHRPPSTVHRPPSTVHRPPSHRLTIHRPPSTVPPSYSKL